MRTPLRGPPFSEIADQLLLFRIDGDRRLAAFVEPARTRSGIRTGRFGRDATRSLTSFAVGLQAISSLLQQGRYGAVRNGMILSCEFLRASLAVLLQVRAATATRSPLVTGPLYELPPTRPTNQDHFQSPTAARRPDDAHASPVPPACFAGSVNSLTPAMHSSTRQGPSRYQRDSSPTQIHPRAPFGAPQRARPSRLRAI